MAAVVAITAAVALAASAMTELSTAGADPSAASASGSIWLAAQIGSDGLIPGIGSRDNSVQAILALSAAGGASADANRALAGLLADVEGYIRPSGVDKPGRLARTILVAVSMARDPHNFGGVDLVARLTATRTTVGADAGLYGTPDPFSSVFNQGLALLAFHAIGSTDVAGSTWLVNQQCPSGAWMGYRATPALTACALTDTNSTALAASSLVALGIEPTHDVLAYFDSTQGADGGWSFTGTGASDPNSTGEVISTLIALNASADARFLDRAASPATALDSFRFGCDAAGADRGAYWYPPFPVDAPRTPDTLATVQAMPAAAGKSLIVSGPATLSTKTPVDPCAPPTTTTTAPAPTASGSGAVSTPASSTTAAGPTRQQIFAVWVWLVQWNQIRAFLDYISHLPKTVRKAAARKSNARRSQPVVCRTVAGRRTCRR